MPRQAGGEAQGGEFSRMTRGEASHSPLPSIMDRFSGPSLGRALGRGGPRPSLLFPFNHPPTIRCSAKWQLGSLIHSTDHQLLRRISNRIINEVRGINRVVLDISSKPPATIEWE